MSHSLDEILPPRLEIELDSGTLYVRAIDPFARVKLKDCWKWFEINHEFDLIENEGGYKKKIDEKAVPIILKKIIEYLREREFDLKFDSQSQLIQQGLDQRKRDFENARKIGVEIKNSDQQEITIPYFNRELYAYQKKPVDLMIKAGNVANFSIPGSGKTTMVYATFAYLKNNSSIDQLFVVGPKASFKPWEDEYEACFNESSEKNVLRYNGSKRKKQLLKFGQYQVVLTNSANASDDEDLLINNLFSGKKILMVIDESHHIKSFRENAYHANAMIRMARSATKRIILTGTPMPHGWEDLWSQFTFLYPDGRVFGTRYNFENILNGNNVESTINERIFPHWTRVSRDDMKDDLPELESVEIKEPMSPLQEEIYRAIEMDNDGIVQTGSDAEMEELRQVRTLRLLQCVTNPGAMKEADIDFELEPYVTNNVDIMEKIKNYSEVPNKIRKTIELALELTKKKKNVIIWCVFRHNVRYLERLLKDEEPIVISGDIPTESNAKTGVKGRDERIDIFKNSRGKILIATLGSIAESVSLHKNKDGNPVCQNAIYLERSFHAGQFMQSVFRLYRIGSNPDLPVKNTYVLSNFSNRNSTIDETVHQRLRERSNRMFGLLNDSSRLIAMNFGSEDEENKIYDDDDEKAVINKKIDTMIEKHRKKK